MTAKPRDAWRTRTGVKDTASARQWVGRGEQAGSPVFEDLVCFHLFDQGLALRGEGDPYLCTKGGVQSLLRLNAGRGLSVVSRLSLHISTIVSEMRLL